MQLRLHRRDPVTKETTPISFSVSGDKFRLLLRGESPFITDLSITESVH